MIVPPFWWHHFLLLLNEMKVSINRNILLFKKFTFKILNEYYRFNKHDIDIFVNDTWQKYAGKIGQFLKVSRWLELRFWPTRKCNQPWQGNFYTQIALKCEPWVLQPPFFLSLNCKFNWQSNAMNCLFSAADRFSLDGLKSLAIFELSSILTIDNVVDIYVDVISSLPVIGKLLNIDYRK